MADPGNTRRETASQTAGPYVHIGLAPHVAGLEHYPSPLGHALVPSDVPGDRITVSGTLLDGSAEPVTDALIEVWQADAAGVYPGTGKTHPGFTGWGRVVTHFKTGQFVIETIKPGAVALPDGTISAPHLNLWIVARGINIGLHTRVYFGDEANANARDPLLRQITDTYRRDTLIAPKRPLGYHFDIRLQGTDETVFLDI